MPEPLPAILEMADELFKSHSIVSLRGMLSKIQTDISQKKSLLRTCVGEKYRDVIQASDSIAKMDNQIKDFQEILGENDQLKQKTKIVKLETHSMGSPHIQAVIHLQILIWVPEQLYKTTDFLIAAGLVITGEWAFDAIMEFEKNSEVIRPTKAKVWISPRKNPKRYFRYGQKTNHKKSFA